MSKINSTYLALRTTLGIFGILLPFILMFGNRFDVQPSISHFYYTRMSVIFTGVLFAFGLLLLSYRGYEKEEERLSDNLLTNFAGLLAVIVAIIPTSCYLLCEAPNSHHDDVLNAIHLISAAGFLVIMGWMSYFRFTKGDDTNPLKQKRNKIYRICGIGIWAALALLAIIMIFNFDLTDYDVFIGETICLIFFGTAWLVKGKALKKFGW